MDRNLFVIGDGTFKRGKPNKHGAVKFRCARHLRLFFSKRAISLFGGST